MKYENFDAASKLVDEIKSKEKLITELTSVTRIDLSRDGRWNILSIDVVTLEGEYSQRGKDMIAWIIEDLKKKVHSLRSELAKL